MEDPLVYLLIFFDLFYYCPIRAQPRPPGRLPLASIFIGPEQGHVTGSPHPLPSAIPEAGQRAVGMCHVFTL